MSKCLTRIKNKNSEEEWNKKIEEWKLSEKWDTLGDSEKLELWRQNKCWDKFYKKYHRLVEYKIIQTFKKFNYERIYDYKDVSSNVFFKIFQKNIFEEGRMKLKNYLALIAYREAYNWVKSNGRCIITSDTDQFEKELKRIDIIEIIEMSISIEKVYPEILKGRERLIEIFEKHYLLGEDEETIADDLGISVGAVKTALCRIRELFRQYREEFF